MYKTNSSSTKIEDGISSAETSKLKTKTNDRANTSSGYSRTITSICLHGIFRPTSSRNYCSQVIFPHQTSFNSFDQTMGKKWIKEHYLAENESVDL